MNKKIFRIDTLSSFNRLVEAGMSPELSKVVSNVVFNIMEEGCIANTLSCYNVLTEAGMSPSETEVFVRTMEKVHKGLCELDICRGLLRAEMSPKVAEAISVIVSRTLKYFDSRI